VAHVLEDSFTIALAKEILIHFANSLKDFKNSDEIIEVGEYAINSWTNKVDIHEVPDTVVRSLLADKYERNEEWETAAKVLMRINLENPTREVTDDEKSDIYVRIA
jgi:COP9 signalosome complex subunit 4